MRTSIARAMDVGASRYADVLAALALDGWAASFTQTGGMCAAIEIRLERGHLLLTDASEELPWDPTQLRGWGVGYYIDEDHSEGPLAYCEDDSDTSIGCLHALVRDCLADAASAASSTR